jgi:hypothetical protein
MGASAHGMTQVGWREWLALPELGIPCIKAKLDTGARSSSLHVERWELFERDGVRWVAFELRPGSRKGKRERRFEQPVLDTRAVTDSSGNRAVRPFIRALVRLGGASWPIEVNLTNRKSMLFPLLLGRTAMSGRYVVDPSRSYVLGRPEKVRAATP